MSTPSTRTEPLVGSSRRLQQRSSVDLPEPDGPITNTSSFGRTARAMPFSTSSAPNDLWSATTSRIALGGSLTRDRPVAAEGKRRVKRYACVSASTRRDRAALKRAVLSALWRDRSGIVAGQLGHAVPGRDLVRPRVRARLLAEPFLVEPGDRSVLLHALDGV